MTLFNALVPSLTRSVRRMDDKGVSTEPLVQPWYDVKESPEAFGVEAHFPGVGRDGLEITAGDGELKVVGRRSWRKPENWETLYRESPVADFELRLTHDNSIDVDKIHAELKDGVLRMTLPKVEAIKPRKIQIS